MRKFQLWVLTLGLVAATSTNASADIFSFLRKKNRTKSPVSKRTARTRSRSTTSKAFNQKVANEIGRL